MAAYKEHYPKEIVEALQEKYGLSRLEIQDILDSQFRFVSNMIKKGNTRGVKLMKFGRVKPKPGKIEVLKERVTKRKLGTL